MVELENKIEKLSNSPFSLKTDGNWKGNLKDMVINLRNKEEDNNGCNSHTGWNN